LNNAGKISKQTADEKALGEFAKYRALGADVSDIEKRFLADLKSTQKKLESSERKTIKTKKMKKDIS
jgi:hypothetical protein